MSLRVVIADDSVSMQARAADGLKGVKNVEIIGRYDNGQDALDAVRALKPDLAVVDNHMPYLTGMEVAKAVAAEGLTTKVLLCSSMAQSCSVGDVRLLVKPFNRTQMAQAVYDLFGTLDF